MRREAGRQHGGRLVRRLPQLRRRRPVARLPQLLRDLGTRGAGPDPARSPAADPRAGGAPHHGRRVRRLPADPHRDQAGAGPHLVDRGRDPLRPRPHRRRGRHGPELPDRPRHPGRHADDLRGDHGHPAQPLRLPGGGRRPLARGAHAGLSGLVRGAGPRPLRGSSGQADLHDPVRPVAVRRVRGPGAAGLPRPVKRKVADKITSMLGLDQQPGSRLDEARARNAESALPGYGGARDEQRPRAERASYDAPGPAPEPANGFAAAYRAVSPAVRRAEPAHGRHRPHGDAGPPGHGGDTPGGLALQHLGQLAGPVPAAGRRGPPSAYDPLNDTGYTIPTYNNSVASGYGSSDVYDTAETNTLYGTYNPGDTYNSGPANAPTPVCPRRPTTSTHRGRANLGTRLPEASIERGPARRPRSPRRRTSPAHVGFRPCRPARSADAPQGARPARAPGR